MITTERRMIGLALLLGGLAYAVVLHTTGLLPRRHEPWETRKARRDPGTEAVRDTLLRGLRDQERNITELTRRLDGIRRAEGAHLIGGL
jgi:hypothetical protein